MSETQSSPRRKWSLAIWLGPVLAVAGVLSYFGYFIRIPALRDFPWTSLVLMAIGIAVSAFGLWRAFGQSDLYRGKLVGSLGLLVSVVATGGFSFLLFVGASQIPEPTKVTQTLQAAPDFALTNQLGKAVQLSSFKGKKVVLDFYRGHW